MSHNPGRFLLPLSAFAATARDTLSRLPLRGWLSADSLISLGTLAGGFLSARLSPITILLLVEVFVRVTT